MSLSISVKLYRRMRQLGCYFAEKNSMTYRDYINQSSFEQIWAHLQNQYQESDEIKTTYQRLYESVKLLPAIKTSEQITLIHDGLGEIKASGTLEPQEELIDREVNLYEGFGGDVSEIAAHLLYWSSMYGFKTAAQFSEDFEDWLDELGSGPYYGSKGMEKYIFLDFDGVLNTEQYQAQLAVAGKERKDKYGPLFDPEAVACLKRLADETKAEIVIISSWRFIHDTDTLYEMWEERGLPDEIFRIMSREVADDNRSSGVKSFAFGKYIPYVILDDEYTYVDEQKPYLIRVNPVKGLTDADVDKAIVILNRFDNYSFLDFHPNHLNDIRSREMQGRIETPSLNRKRLRYWRDTIIDDSAISWSWNLTVLKKKLEYNIGYWKYVQRHVGWREDVRRMELCCRLLEIASEDYPEMAGIFVNTANAERYGMTIMNDDFLEIHLKDLRKEKAYRILWQYLDHNMKKWWD